MILTINGIEYSVIWRYTNVQVGNEHTSKATQCIIRMKKPDQEKPVELASATVRCFWKDLFCKNCGRKSAMAKAIDVARDTYFQTKEERRAFWDAYHNMRHGKY